MNERGRGKMSRNVASERPRHKKLAGLRQTQPLYHREDTNNTANQTTDLHTIDNGCTMVIL